MELLILLQKKNSNPYWLNYGIKYDDPVGITPFLNVGFNRGMFNYDLNIQSTNSDGYDLTPKEGEYNMTLDESKSHIYNHSLAIIPSERYSLEFQFKDYSSKIWYREGSIN